MTNKVSEEWNPPVGLVWGPIPEPAEYTQRVKDQIALQQPYDDSIVVDIEPNDSQVGYTLPDPPRDCPHVTEIRNTTTRSTETNRNNTFAPAFAGVSICRFFNCASCPVGWQRFCVQKSQKGILTARYHVCSLFIPSKGEVGAPCGGSHPAYMCPHWEEAFAYARNFQNFKQLWRFGTPDRGVAVEVAYYRDIAPLLCHEPSEDFYANERRNMLHKWGWQVPENRQAPQRPVEVRLEQRETEPMSCL